MCQLHFNVQNWGAWSLTLPDLWPYRRCWTNRGIYACSGQGIKSSGIQKWARSSLDTINDLWYFNRAVENDPSIDMIYIYVCVYIYIIYFLNMVIFHRVKLREDIPTWNPKNGEMKVIHPSWGKGPKNYTLIGCPGLSGTDVLVHFTWCLQVGPHFFHMFSCLTLDFCRWNRLWTFFCWLN